MSDIASNDVALVFSTRSILSQNKENVQPPPTLTLRNAELGPVLQARSAVSDIQRLRFVSAAEMRPERPPLAMRQRQVRSRSGSIHCRVSARNTRKTHAFQAVAQSACRD
jgi:hypothetical protein